jgi:hypothetical protein
VIHRGATLLLRAGRALACIRGNRQLERVAIGPTAGCEYRLPGRDGRWLVRLSDVDREGSLGAFGKRAAALTGQTCPTARSC